MMTPIFYLIFSLQLNRSRAFGLTHCSASVPYVSKCTPRTHLYSNAPRDDEDISSEDNEEGVSLAADFFKALQERNIELSEDDFLDEDHEDDEEDYDEMDDEESKVSSELNEDDEEDEEDEEVNIPEGAVNAFVDYDEKAANVSLTNEQVYSELKERVLESAGSFIDLVGGAADDDDDDSGDDKQKQKEYVPPKTVPDSLLTAGEVVTTVLDALLHNDVPHKDRGIEILFAYSSPGSAILQAIEVEGMTPSEYGEFLKDEENEYRVLFDHMEVIIDKGDYSFDNKKAFFTAKLRVGGGPLDFTNVNFILSTSGTEEDDCWLIDTLLIRPEGMRRRRRR